MKSKKIKLQVGFSVFAMLAAAIFGGRPVEYSAALTAALLHELGHIVAAKLLGVRFVSLSLDLLGARLGSAHRSLSYREELLLAAAGPAVNILSALAVYPVIFRAPEFMTLFLSAFTAASVGLAVLNLLPIVSFDGGRILDCLLSLLFDGLWVRRLLRVVSFLCIFTLWSASVYLLLKTAGGLSVFVFSAALFARLFANE